MTITRDGYVLEEPENNVFDIGLIDWGGLGGDGSVTVTAPSEYLLEAQGDYWTTLRVGGYFGIGELTITGHGARTTLRGASDADSVTQAIIGTDAGDERSLGTLNITDGGELRVEGHGGQQIGALLIGEIFGRGVANLDHGLITLTGFDHAEVILGEDARGEATLTDGSRIDLTTNNNAELWLGRDGGDGFLTLQGGSVVDLGADGLAVIGKSIGWDDTAIPQGQLTIAGAESQLIAGQTWVGHDPATIEETPRSSGTLELADRGTVGVADGAKVSIGVLGTLVAHEGIVAGDLELAGGTVQMGALDDRLIVTGDLTATGAGNWMGLGGDPTSNAWLTVDGTFRMAEGAELTFVLDGNGHQYAAGEHLKLVTADHFDFGATRGAFNPNVHAAFADSFGWVFGTVASEGGSGQVLTFDALNNMDGSGAARLGLTGADAAVVEYDAGRGRFDIAGGQYLWAEAVAVTEIRGTAGNDRFLLGDMTTGMRVEANAGNNEFIGGTGDDTFVGGAGNDTFDGGGGNDEVIFDVASTAVAGTAADGWITLISAEGQDRISDSIEVVTFTDRSLSWAELQAELAANPTVLGTDGNDALVGTPAAERLLAGAGDDWITPGGGNDTVDGGPGIDMVSFVDRDERVVVDLGAGTASVGADNLVLENIENVTGTIWADLITGDAGDNRLRGLGGYDWFVGSDGSDTYEGGTGRDTVSYAFAERMADGTGVHANLRAGTGTKGQAEGDVYDSIESLTGSSHKDWLVGSDEANVLRGLGGDDIIFGYGGNDTIDGGAGNDWLDGGDGNDRITGGAGNDTIIGGRGWDTAIYSGNKADYQVETWSNGWVSVFDTRGIDGVDVLIEMNVIEFADGKLWL